MKICYHGTNEENAKSILKEGFQPNTYFARHLEDALGSGGMHVFEVAFDDPPDHWQFGFPDKWVKPDRIIGYMSYQRQQITDNKALRKEVFDSPKIPKNRAAAWRSFKYGEWKKKDAKFDHETFNKIIDETHESSDGTMETWFKHAEEGDKKIKELCGGRPPWKPNARYNEAGDMIHIYLSDEMSYTRWLTPMISVILAEETDEVIGFEIWGASHVKDIKSIVEKFASLV